MRLEELTRLGWENRVIVMDKDDLWKRLGGDVLAASHSYARHYITDEMALRHLYEIAYRTGEARCLMLLSNPSIHVPFDIHQRFFVVDLSLNSVFPNIPADVLRGLNGLDYEHLALAMDRYVGPDMAPEHARHFCTATLYEPEYAQPYAEALLKRCLSTAESNTSLSYLDWTKIAARLGKALMLMRGSSLTQHVAEQTRALQMAFETWMAREYRKLYSEVNLNQPVLLSGAADHLRRQGGKTALVVLDGMSFENLYTIQRALSGSSISMDIQGVFSFLPSVTVVARQCLFAGKLPVELPDLSSLINEEKQWRSFWKNIGLRDEEIYFAKADTLDINERWKAVGLVINMIDDLMHSQLQGMDGMARNIDAWVKTGRLHTLLLDLIKAGFQVFLTSDHGNTSAIAQGRFRNPGVLAEPASRRAVVYRSYADAIELDKFNVNQYPGTYLPEGSNAWLFGPGTCYGDKGKEYITHGGMTIEEVIVPFIRIGA